MSAAPYPADEQYGGDQYGEEQHGGNEREQTQDHRDLQWLSMGDATGTRTRSTGVTADLTEIWPEVRPRLMAYLRARGLNGTNADDVIQDVAERMMRHDVSFTDADDLLRWCVPVARNASIDQFRRSSRTVLVAVLPDQAREDDVADTVNARLRLHRVLDGFSRLSQSDRAALAEAIEGSTEAVTDSATRVRRHRARRRLLEIAGPPAIVVGLVRIARRLWRPGIATAIPAAMAASFIVWAGHPGDVDPRITLPAAPALVRPVIHSLAASTTVRRATGATRHHAARSGQTDGRATVPSGSVHLTAPDPAHEVNVYGHDRGSQDNGLVCVGRLPVVDVDVVCVGPTLRP